MSVLEEAGKGAETLVQGRLELIQAESLKSWVKVLTSTVKKYLQLVSHLRSKYIENDES